MRSMRSRRRRPACRPAATPSRSGARSWRARFDGARAAHAAGPAPAAVHCARSDLPRQAFEDVIDGVAMDLDTTRYDTFDDLFEYCRRVASAVGLICIRIFGCTSAAGLRVRGESRRRAAADQHPSRCRRRSGEGARLSAARGLAPVRLHRGRPDRGHGHRSRPAAAGVRMPARARLLSARDGGAATGGSQEARGRRDHAGGLLRDAAADRTERLRRVQRAGPRAAAATGADCIEAVAMAG